VRQSETKDYTAIHTGKFTLNVIGLGMGDNQNINFMSRYIIVSRHQFTGNRPEPNCNWSAEINLGGG